LVEVSVVILRKNNNTKEILNEQNGNTAQPRR